MSPNLIAVTAGVGSSSFEKAAIRVSRKLSLFPQITKSVAVTTSELVRVCPKVSETYGNYLNDQTRGFGYMTYKAEIVNNAFNGMWGPCEGVIWVDAGCEVLANPLTSMRLNYFLRHAKRHGVACFTLDTPEIKYTKRDLFNRFPNIDPLRAGPQIQTTWFALYGSKGKQISEQWLEIVLEGIGLMDLSPSISGEFPEFIENRYDQSAFSLTCKSAHVPVMRYKPASGIGSWKSKLRAFSHPFWTSRNRSGSSQIPRLFRAWEFK